MERDRQSFALAFYGKKRRKHTCKVRGQRGWDKLSSCIVRGRIIVLDTDDCDLIVDL